VFTAGFNFGYGSLAHLRDVRGVAALACVFVWRLAPETTGRPREAIRFYGVNGGGWPDEEPARERAPLTSATAKEA
jgi:hypothetical protein